jgi:hypothetical protein
MMHGAYNDTYCETMHGAYNDTYCETMHGAYNVKVSVFFHDTHTSRDKSRALLYHLFPALGTLHTDLS